MGVEHLDAHAAPGGSSERIQCDIDELALVVSVQLGTAKHAGDQDILVPVFIVIKDRHVAAPAASLQADLLGDIGESAVAVVVVEDVVFLGTLDHRVKAISSLALEGLAGRVDLVECPVGGVDHVEVQESVVVVVEENGGLRVTDVFQAGRLGDVLQDAAALVLVKDIATAGARNEEVLVAIVVDIGERAAHANSVVQPDPDFLGHILEGPVTAIPKQAVGSELVQEKHVLVTVTVVVGNRHTTPVVVEIDLEGRSRFVGEKTHVKIEP